MNLEQFRKINVGDHMVYVNNMTPDIIFFGKVQTINKIVSSYNHIIFLKIIYRSSPDGDDVFEIHHNDYNLQYFLVVTDKKQIDKYYKLSVFE